MKRTLTLILCALCLSLAAAPVFALKRTASAAAYEESEESNTDYFRYDVTEAGGYYGINYYVDICANTAEAVNAKYPAPPTEKSGIDRVLDSVEAFFYAYENLFFNNARAGFAREKAAAYDKENNPYHSFHMRLAFESGGQGSAREKHREYFGIEDGGAKIPPSKSNFFAAQYRVFDRTHFWIPEGTPDYAAFRSENYNLDDIRPFAELNCIMMPFLLYGNVLNNGFKDEPDQKIDYVGLVSLFPLYFNADRGLTRNTFFKNYSLSHWLSAPTRYIKTDADFKERYRDEYTHAWRVNAALDTEIEYSPNRWLDITYIVPKTVNLYYLAVMISVGFIAVAAGLLYGISAYRKKLKTEN